VSDFLYESDFFVVTRKTPTLVDGRFLFTCDRLENRRYSIDTSDISNFTTNQLTVTREYHLKNATLLDAIVHEKNCTFISIDK